MKQKDHRNRSSKTANQRKVKRLIVIGLIVVAAISIGISLAIMSYKLLPSSNGILSLDGIQCNASEHSYFMFMRIWMSL